MSAVAALSGACGKDAPGPAAPTAPVAEPTPDPAGAAPTCEQAVEHILKLLAAALEGQMAGMSEDEQAQMRAEIAKRQDESRPRFVEQCKVEASPALRACIVKAPTVDDLARCDDGSGPRRGGGGGRDGAAGGDDGDGPNCEAVVDHVLQLMAAEVEQMIAAQPEDKRAQVRKDMERQRAHIRGDFLATCRTDASPALRRCILDAKTAAEVERCEPRHDGAGGEPPK